MKNILMALMTLLVAIYAQDDDKDAIVLEQNQAVNTDGSYSYVWRTSNGISVQESGIGGVSAQGSYDFISSDGVPVSLQYEADENGYRPSSNLLPQPPAIPDYIVRALEYIRNNPPLRF